MKQITFFFMQCASSWSKWRSTKREITISLNFQRYKLARNICLQEFSTTKVLQSTHGVLTFCWFFYPMKCGFWKISGAFLKLLYSLTAGKILIKENFLNSSLNICLTLNTRAEFFNSKWFATFQRFSNFSSFLMFGLPKIQNSPGLGSCAFDSHIRIFFFYTNLFYLASVLIPW